MISEPKATKLGNPTLQAGIFSKQKLKHTSLSSPYTDTIQNLKSETKHFSRALQTGPLELLCISSVREIMGNYVNPLYSH